MITKGYILDYSTTSKNRFKVRIPYFESAGIGKNHSYTQSVFEDVPISYSPGNIAGFKIGDCVFIAFEDSSFDKPVIIGKLYLGKEKESSNYQFSSVLEVTQRATLPKNTSFGGDLTLEDILELRKQVTYMPTEQVYFTDGQTLEEKYINGELGGGGSVPSGDVVTGIKGDNETTYRKGEVNITPENIGAYSTEEVDEKHRLMNDAIVKKQNTLIDGDGIDIDDENVISVTAMTNLEIEAILNS